MRVLSLLLIPTVFLASAETDETKAKVRGIRDYAKQGSSAISRIEPYLEDREDEVRWEAVKAIVDIGTQHSLTPLMKALEDNQPEIQMRATDGLVNFYLPGYIRTGVTASLKKASGSFRSRFQDTSSEIIDPNMEVRPEIIAGLGKVARGSASMDARANAARAIGILRGRQALPDLYEALLSKNDLVLFESLIAVQKIRDIESGPKVQFLLRDLHDRVQIAAIETAGILRNRAALADLRDVLDRGRNIKIKRAALTAIAMMPAEESRSLYTRYFEDRDEGLRGAAAEGFARLKSASDLPAMEKAFEEEKKANARLSLAFACVMLGKRDISEFSPLQYLINTLNSKLYRDSAEPLLTELAREPEVRQRLYPALKTGTKDERIRIARILGQTGDRDTLPHLESVKNDLDSEIAQEGIRAARSIQSRLP